MKPEYLEGEYQLGFQELNTGMTKRYKRRYSWFKKHLHIKDVPNFTGIYIHIGNDESHTSGCILLGNTATINTIANGSLRSSTAAYKRFYKLVANWLKKGEEVIVKISNIEL